MIRLFLFLLLFVGVVFGENNNSVKLTEYRLNQMEKEFITIKEANQKLVSENKSLTTVVASLKEQNTKQYDFYKDSIESNENTHNNVLEPLAD